MVVFYDDPEKYKSPEMFLKLQENMTEIIDVLKIITRMEEQILLNPTVSRNEFKKK